MVAAVPINQAAKRTLLQIIQDVCKELAILQPTTVIGNTDLQITQLLQLANREGREFYQQATKNGGWQELRTEYTFSTAGVGGLTGNVTNNSAIVTNISSTTNVLAGYIASGNGIPVGTSVISVDSSSQVTLSVVAQATTVGTSLSFGKQSYSLPSDFGYFINTTFWDRARRWQLLGPLNPAEWQVIKSGISPTGPRRRFRVMGNLFYIDPVPTSVDVEVYEYYSTGWCQSVAGVAQSLWAADTDYYSLDDDCLELGIIWRYLSAKRFSYDEERNTWLDAKDRVIARNGGNRTLPLNSTSSGINLINNNNIPDTGFGT